MFIKIDRNTDSTYIYKQIYQGIKESILNEKIHSNEKLPPKRVLADELNVSVNSVSNAYEQLLAEGYIYTVERKGYYVENIAQFIEKEDVIKNKLPDDLKEEWMDKKGWLSLSHMTADISIFPFKEWMKQQQQAIQQYKRELSEITHHQGPYIVRKTICRMLALSRGVHCEPEQIIIGAGTQLLVRQLMAIQDKQKIIAMENPGYARNYNLLRNMHFKVLPIPLDEQGINMEEVEASNANFVFVTPSHQFPTGRIMPISRRIELLNWAIQTNDRYIVEDDYDSEFKYETDNIPSLQSLDRHHRVIYMGTFSKTMLPGMRVSYMVLPPELLREYRENYHDLMQPSNSLILYTLHYFIESGEYTKHLKRMNHQYETRRKILIKHLQMRFGKKVQIEDIPAGLHFLARFHSEKGYQEIEERAREIKLEVYSMRRFMLKDNFEEKNRIDLVLGFANISEENIPEAVERLYQVF
ncbi:PLP-dependent aminotransferase family protein [Neobacillus mesonae]|uniref:MocR-like transcriptional regulator GabR n=1 Tax=Neobacillus mesonae TaxID=1193713 RepID=UPI00203BF455|nr:PLP-dependent aminotransferase family protein [Neobacillus mesonae]MCM3570595.1 PLP-dependent aminotransferase family protein [Neobacillus mesonae]